MVGVVCRLGYLFANSLTAIAESMARFGDVLAALIGIPLTGFIGWRVWIIVHMLRHLRLRRITPSLLHERIKSGERIAIIDLLKFESQEHSAGIHPRRCSNGPGSSPQPTASGGT